MGSYENFARVYDELMDNVPYEEWADFILAILNLIFFYFKLYDLLNITTVLLLVSIIIEFFNGYIRGYFGIVSYIISVILGIYFINDIWHGISIGISILSNSQTSVINSSIMVNSSDRG